MDKVRSVLGHQCLRVDCNRKARFGAFQDSLAGCQRSIAPVPRLHGLWPIAQKVNDSLCEVLAGIVKGAVDGFHHIRAIDRDAISRDMDITMLTKHSDWPEMFMVCKVRQTIDFTEGLGSFVGYFISHIFQRAAGFSLISGCFSTPSSEVLSI